MENNPLDNLPPETRQRVENVLQALGGRTPPQNVFVTQYPGEIVGHMLQETRQYAEEAFDSQQKKQIGHDQAWAHWESGTYFPLNAGRLELESVKMTASPAVLHFKMLKRNQDGSWTGTAQRIHVIVPHGYEEEAEQLRQRYYTDVIKSWKKPTHPPEPN